MRTTMLTLALAITLAACGSTASPAPSTITSSGQALGGPKVADAGGLTTTTQATDPWDALQATAKAAGIDATFLDRDEALARALLGCGTTWPPNTLDALLAQAYAPQISQARAQGHCTTASTS